MTAEQQKGALEVVISKLLMHVILLKQKVKQIRVRHVQRAQKTLKNTCKQTDHYGLGSIAQQNFTARTGVVLTLKTLRLECTMLRM